MNRVLAHTGARYPIVQAPMGWIARSRLASAVCGAGGLGVIEASSGETKKCKAEILRMRELTSAPSIDYRAARETCGGMRLRLIVIAARQAVPHPIAI